jgi:hypothetical protein
VIKREAIALDFEVDKLTNSIENVVSGDSFPTVITLLIKADLKTVTKKVGWQFDWKYELNQPEREVYKLTIPNNRSIIQGLISVEIKSDHIYMHLVESAPYNKGKTKIYSGVPGNLVAFACRLSFQRGFEGNVSFISKTKLVDHYIKTLGAIHFGGGLMIIETRAALKLIDKYFKNTAT